MKKRIFYFIVLPLVLALSCVGIKFTVNYYKNMRLISSPMNLTHENDIRNACEIMLKKMIANPENHGDYIQKLEITMVKLRDGWPGFKIDNYYPYHYSTHQLLGEIYWAVAYTAATQPKETQQLLMNLLIHTQPEKHQHELLKAYQLALIENKLALPHEW